MLVLTLGPSLAAFVAIFPRGHKPKAWPFALVRSLILLGFQHRQKIFSEIF